MTRRRFKTAERIRLQKIVFTDRYDPVTGEIIYHGNICYLCEGEIDLNLPPGLPGSPEIEHIEAWSQGGGNDISNLRPSHKLCNGKKSDFDAITARRNILAERGTSRVW